MLAGSTSLFGSTGTADTLRPGSIPVARQLLGASALFVSRWSIRRKLLVCLAIVLAIVAALAYSGFSGGYSYRELAWTIRVRRPI